MSDPFTAATCAALGHPLEHEVEADDGRGGLVLLRIRACGHRRETPKELTP